jgi:transcriptional regulator with XRE-family HTH domain
MLTQRLQDAGMTPATLAARLGVSRQTVHGWLHEHHYPTGDRCRQLAVVLGGIPSEYARAEITDVQKCRYALESARYALRRLLDARLYSALQIGKARETELLTTEIERITTTLGSLRTRRVIVEGVADATDAVTDAATEPKP